MIPIQEGRLSGLSRGQTAQVTALLAAGPIRRRFQDLGLIPGTTVECLGRSPLGDPCAYLIRGAVIALRRSDADTVTVAAAENVAEPAVPLRLTGLEQAVDHGAY